MLLMFSRSISKDYQFSIIRRTRTWKPTHTIYCEIHLMLIVLFALSYCNIFVLGRRRGVSYMRSSLQCAKSSQGAYGIT